MNYPTDLKYSKTHEWVKEEVKKLRAEHLEMKYCFSDKDTEELLNAFASATGI